MKLNWRVRFRNPVWLTSLLALAISTVYQALAMFDVAPKVTEDAITRVAAALVQLLTLLGVLIDPTTAGISDSERALGYREPN